MTLVAPHLRAYFSFFVIQINDNQCSGSCGRCDLSQQQTHPAGADDHHVFSDDHFRVFQSGLYRIQPGVRSEPLRQRSHFRLEYNAVSGTLTNSANPPSILFRRHHPRLRSDCPCNNAACRFGRHCKKPQLTMGETTTSSPALKGFAGFFMSEIIPDIS